MARLNVYVPDELLIRLRERRPDIKLSRLVQDALEEALGEEVPRPVVQQVTLEVAERKMRELGQELAALRRMLGRGEDFG